MSGHGETKEQSWARPRSVRAGSDDPRPGLLQIFSGESATVQAIVLEGEGRERSCVLGRGVVGGARIDDACMSRRHAEVRFDGARWHVTDLGSRNGTFLDGVKVSGVASAEAPRVVRTGDSLFAAVADVRPYANATVAVTGGVVIGPTLGERWARIERAAHSGDTLHVAGESGSGKELAARHFHGAGPRAAGPFVAVNCATIPPNLAERLLFGARKGAYSGADADVDGYVQAAHGGTLFLDEIAELEAGVQAKLLRMIESREVMPLGATRARRVELSLCSASHRDLRRQVSEGRFREDLFFRIGRPAVALPSLRERADDIAWLIQEVLERAGAPRAHVTLVEACLLRPWPGNVRELQIELRDAAAEASHAGQPRVEVAHLSLDAGQPIRAAGEQTAGVATMPQIPRALRPAHDDAAVLEALRAAGGRVATAARALGWHRTQLRRWLERNGSALEELRPRCP